MYKAGSARRGAARLGVARLGSACDFSKQIEKITLTGEVVFWDRQDAAPKGANLASPLCAIFLFQTPAFFEQLKTITLTGVVVFWARPTAFLTTFGDHFPSF